MALTGLGSPRGNAGMPLAFAQSEAGKAVSSPPPPSHTSTSAAQAERSARIRIKIAFDGSIPLKNTHFASPLVQIVAYTAVREAPRRDKSALQW